mmetsp:Transcript_31685/g.53238  ORF Transcript_31685/g.53238 Transcript_31685/m.53238 type:complete len:255 (+) Transcript_31685:1445-2209(+)
MTCSMIGCVAFANFPTTSRFRGILRQPTTFSPSAKNVLITISLACLALASSFGKNTFPAPEHSSLYATFSASAHFAITFQGICTITPAPSPESSSAEHPPRCSMQPSPVRACWITLWLLSPARLAMMPTPHPSRSARILSMSATGTTFAPSGVCSSHVVVARIVCFVTRRHLMAEVIRRKPLNCATVTLLGAPTLCIDITAIGRAAQRATRPTPTGLEDVRPERIVGIGAATAMWLDVDTLSGPMATSLCRNLT